MEARIRRNILCLHEDHSLCNERRPARNVMSHAAEAGFPPGKAVDSSRRANFRSGRICLSPAAPVGRNSGRCVCDGPVRRSDALSIARLSAASFRKSMRKRGRSTGGRKHFRAGEPSACAVYAKCVQGNQDKTTYVELFRWNGPDPDESARLPGIYPGERASLPQQQG